MGVTSPTSQVKSPGLKARSETLKATADQRPRAVSSQAPEPWETQWSHEEAGGHALRWGLQARSQCRPGLAVCGLDGCSPSYELLSLCTFTWKRAGRASDWGERHQGLVPVSARPVHSHSFTGSH